MHAAIIAGVDTPPFVDYGEQVFDQVTFLVGLLVVTILHFAVGFWQDAGSDFARCQRGGKPVAA